MKQNILNTWKVGAVILIGLIALSPDTSSLSIIGSMWFITGWLPRAAYHLSYEIEMHAAETYAKYLAYEDWYDKDIWRIMNDEIQHFQELQEAMRILDPDRLTAREKDLEPFPPDLSDLLKQTESSK